MKTEELTALGLTDEQAKQVIVIHGKDIESHKQQIEDRDKRITTLEGERDNFKTRFETADAALKKFEGIDPEKIQDEIQTYKDQLDTAKKDFAKQLTQRDQKDWITAQLDKYGVKSPFARKQLISDCMSEESGLTWKDGAFFGFDDFMKAAKEKDESLYMTAEEKDAAEKEAELKEKAPVFTGSTGAPVPAPEKYEPPKIF